MRMVIKVLSIIIILFGLIHIYFASCRSMDIDTLWFIGAGFAIIFPGLLNLVAIDRGGSKFTITTALIINVLMFIMFCLALLIINELQVYLGITIFLISSLAFLIRLLRNHI